MPTRHAHIHPRLPRGELTRALETLREVNGVPASFPLAVLAEAAAVVNGRDQRVYPAGTHVADGEVVQDLREIHFVTLDPQGSRDLDQALHIERSGPGGTGYTLRYAIADVPSFVLAGGAIDGEARKRGQTLYLPDGSVPLHPPVLSEDRVSLLPGVDRAAFVWTIPVDASGAAAIEGATAPAARVERAVIRSRAQLDYESAQVALDAGDVSGSLALLPEFGRLRVEQEELRGGASLNMPDEEVIRDERGYRIERRCPLPVEEWNAQLSLLTGMVAGHMMLREGIGILRTMPAPDARAQSDFRTRVAALGLPWADGVPYGEYLRGVPRGTGQGVAILHAAASLFRGADYAAFGVAVDDGDGDAGGEAGGASRLAPPADPIQAAIAAPYAHVTAPLRRLADRWALVICAAHCAGTAVPSWVRESLGELPALMRASSSFAGRLGAEALNRVEAALLRHCIGEVLPAIVVEVRGSSARVQISDPPVTAHCPASGPLGTLVAGAHISVRVLRADVPSGSIELEVA